MEDAEKVIAVISVYYTIVGYDYEGSLASKRSATIAAEIERSIEHGKHAIRQHSNAGVQRLGRHVIDARIFNESKDIDLTVLEFEDALLWLLGSRGNPVSAMDVKQQKDNENYKMPTSDSHTSAFTKRFQCQRWLQAEQCRKEK